MPLFLKDRERDLLSVDSLPRCLQQPGPNQTEARRLELSLGLPWGYQGPKCLPGCVLAEVGIRSGARTWIHSDMWASQLVALPLCQTPAPSYALSFMVLLGVRRHVAVTLAK